MGVEECTLCATPQVERLVLHLLLQHLLFLTLDLRLLMIAGSDFGFVILRRRLSRVIVTVIQIILPFLAEQRGHFSIEDVAALLKLLGLIVIEIRYAYALLPPRPVEGVVFAETCRWAALFIAHHGGRDGTIRPVVDAT